MHFDNHVYPKGTQLAELSQLPSDGPIEGQLLIRSKAPSAAA